MKTKNCVVCGKLFVVYPSQKDQRCCSYECAGTLRLKTRKIKKKPKTLKRIVVHAQKGKINGRVFGNTMSKYIDTILVVIAGVSEVAYTNMDEIIIHDGWKESEVAIEWAGERGVDIKVVTTNTFYRKGASTVRDTNMCKRAGALADLILFWDGKDKSCLKLKTIAENYFLKVKEVIV